jgi:hypothetical protein
MDPNSKMLLDEIDKKFATMDIGDSRSSLTRRKSGSALLRTPARTWQLGGRRSMPPWTTSS